MNLHWIDWLIVISLLGFICVSAYTTRQYMRSVADFLSANRCAGKYLLGVADGIAGLGAFDIDRPGDRIDIVEIEVAHCLGV